MKVLMRFFSIFSLLYQDFFFLLNAPQTFQNCFNSEIIKCFLDM